MKPFSRTCHEVALALVYLLLCAFIANPARAQNKGLSGYVMEQRCSLSGIHKITATANGVRFDGSCYVMVSKAPKWDVFIWHRQRKIYSQVSYKNWQMVNPPTLLSDRTDMIKPVAERRFRKQGEIYVSYVFPKTVYQAQANLFQTEEKADSRELVSTLTCLDWPADQHASTVLGRFYLLPPIIRGMPVAIDNIGKGYKGWELRTAKMSHLDDLSPALFECPAGLKKVPFASTIFISNNTKNALEDYIDGAR